MIWVDPGISVPVVEKCWSIVEKAAAKYNERLFHLICQKVLTQWEQRRLPLQGSRLLPRPTSSSHVHFLRYGWCLDHMTPPRSNVAKSFTSNQLRSGFANQFNLEETHYIWHFVYACLLVCMDLDITFADVQGPTVLRLSKLNRKWRANSNEY